VPYVGLQENVKQKRWEILDREVLERAGLDVELPFQVGAHLMLHLVDLLKGKHILTNDTPGLVGISVITDDLGSNHEGRDEEEGLSHQSLIDHVT
jgi:hypothetical protein